jgi:hypothetical protein
MAQTAERRMIMATCQICKYAGNAKDKPPCADCRGYSKYEYEKPLTNAERIRAMSDEELAYWVMCPYDDVEPDSCPKGCMKCTLEWLKQPAEE